MHIVFCMLAAEPPAPSSPPGGPSAADGREGDMWLALIVLGLIVVVFSLGRWLGKKRTSRSAPDEARPLPRDATGGAAGELRGVGRASEQVQELLADIESLAREMNARIDTKILVLEALIRQADERIARLGPDSGHAAASGGDYESGVSTDPVSTDPVSAGPAGDEDAAGEDKEGPDERFREIYELADDGLSAPEISQKTGVLTGEVELILGLRNRRSQGT